MGEGPARSRLRAACIALSALLLLAAPPARAGEAQLGEEPAPTNVEDVKSGFDKKGVERVAPRLGHRLLPRLLRGSRLDVHLRTYYFNQAQDSDTPFVQESDRAAWAYGGWLRFESPWWFDRVNVAAAYFTSQRIWGPERLDGTRLLADGQHGYSVLGLANVKLRHGEVAQLTLYRHLLDLPFLNRQDNRMTPNTFEGASFQGRYQSLHYAAGWISRMKTRNSRHFDSMAEVAGVMGYDRGLAYLGARWQPTEAFQVSLIDHYVPDVLNILYAETSFTRPLTDEIGLRLELQLTDQRSIGDELLGGGDFETWRIGLRGVLSWRGVGFELAFSWTDEERGIVSPFGSDPSYLSTMQDDFEAAGDRALLLGISHNFARWDLPNLTSVVKLVVGENATTRSSDDERRGVEATLDYRIAEGRLRGLWFRLRGSYFEDGPIDSGQVRFIVNYDIPIF